jgi:hypothetical protein
MAGVHSAFPSERPDSVIGRMFGMNTQGLATVESLFFGLGVICFAGLIVAAVWSKIIPMLVEVKSRRADGAAHAQCAGAPSAALGVNSCRCRHKQRLPTELLVAFCFWTRITTSLYCE